MIYILDTADLEDIKHCNEYYPLAGVTTNPSIISKEKAITIKYFKIAGSTRPFVTKADERRSRGVKL